MNKSNGKRATQTENKNINQWRWTDGGGKGKKIDYHRVQVVTGERESGRKWVAGGGCMLNSIN